MQGEYWTIAGTMLALALASGIAEHRRRKRSDLDRVGWMPWAFLQYLALLGTLIAASVAINLR